MNDENYGYLWQRRYDIKLRALMNRLYYQERQRHFEWREGFIKAASILAGSVALTKIADPDIVQLCAAFITASSTFSLVFGYGNKARDSVKRSAEWAQLERDIDQVGERDFTEELINQWLARANDIEADEPAAHHILLDRCFKRAVKTLGGTDTVVLSFFDRHFPLIMIP